MKFKTILLFAFFVFFTQNVNAQCYAFGSYIQNGNTVTFIDSSYTQYGHTSQWDFGNGSSAYGSVVTTTYANSGSYTACLTIEDSVSNCIDTFCFVVSVSNTSNCNASFTYVQDSTNPQTFYFTNTSTNASSAYWWFGGNNSSTAYNPTYTFSGTGYQTVCLISYDSVGNFCDSVCQSIYIAPQNTSSCFAGFTYTVDSMNMSPNSYPVSFSNYSDSLNYLWNFGDSSTSTLRDPSYTYTGSGTYTVCLYLISAYDSLGLPIICDTFCTNVTVGSNATPSCQASFYVGVDSNNLYNLYIVNNSTGTNSSTSYVWTFGDGDSSTTQNPTHQYAAFGLYELCLTTTTTANGQTCTSTHCDSIGMDSTGALLKKDGFGITVISESQFLIVKENDYVQQARIYPNPSSGVYALSLNLTASQKVSLEVYNCFGQVVLTQYEQANVGENIYKLVLENQENGMYYLTIRAGNQVEHAKLYLSK